jgi:hypothetical protein
MDVMLAGGPAAVIGLSVDQIRDKALEARRKGAATRSRRAFLMGLCLEGAAGASWLYSLGAARKHWEGFFDLSEGAQAKLRVEIMANVASGKAKGGRTSLTEAKRRAGTASRTDVATSRYQGMFERLRVLKGEASLPKDVTTWFETTKSGIAKVKGPRPRSKALRELGILGQADYKEFNKLFKKNGGYEKTPAHTDPGERAEHKKEQLEAKMKFIRQHPLPSQKKRKVLGAKGEEERLATVLWHDLTNKACRKEKGHHDDSD